MVWPATNKDSIHGPQVITGVATATATQVLQLFGIASCNETKSGAKESMDRSWLCGG